MGVSFPGRLRDLGRVVCSQGGIRVETRMEPSCRGNLTLFKCHKTLQVQGKSDIVTKKYCKVYQEFVSLK